MFRRLRRLIFGKPKSEAIKYAKRYIAKALSQRTAELVQEITQANMEDHRGKNGVVYMNDERIQTLKRELRAAVAVTRDEVIEDLT